MALAQQMPPIAALKSAFGGPAVEAAHRFAYRLRIMDAEGGVLRDADHVLLPAERRLYQRNRAPQPAAETWSDAQGSWRLIGTQWEFLGPALAAPLRQHVAYHFLALLHDPATVATPVARDRLRIVPRGSEPFEVVLEAGSGRIVENRFASGRHARELDYHDIAGVQWPMAFEVRDASGALQRSGRFSDVHVDTLPRFPALRVGQDAPRLPEPAADVARLVGAGWLSGARNDYNLSLDAAGTRLVFGRSQAEFRHAAIWTAQREGDRWTEPKPLPFTDPRYSDSDPWLTPDGRTLYFVSNRSLDGGAPRPDLDLWRAAVTGDGFGAPEHLAALSSPGQELGPELHDGWLYFNSSRANGPAKLAIYRAQQVSGGFGPPQSLPAPFNDGTAQGDFTLSPDGRTAVFWSLRDGHRDGDLFAVRREGNGWSEAVRLPAPVNAEGMDFTPSFSIDGRSLYFASMRKPAWLDDPGHVLNGESNVYVVPAGLIASALAQAPD